MGLVTKSYTFTNGTVADATQVNADLDTLYNVVNGSLDSANLTTTTKNTWLKLATVADRKAKWGTDTIPSFDSVAGRSKASATVTHGLGTTPVVAFVTAGGLAIQEGAGQYAVAVSVTALTSTTFSYVATVNGTTNNGAPLYWLVIG